MRSRCIPVVPEFSRFKITKLAPLLSRARGYLNPQWGLHAPTMISKIVASMVALTHHECNNAVCKGVSFTYGTGFPALWSHENLNEATHEWIKQEFAQVPVIFSIRWQRASKQGNLVLGRWTTRSCRPILSRGAQHHGAFCFFRGHGQSLFPRGKPAADF